MNPETKAFGEKMIEAVKGYVARATKPLSDRIDDIDTRIKAIPAGPQGERGDKGYPGESIIGPKGDPGESVRGDKGDPGESIKGDKGDPGESIKGDPGESIKGNPGEMGPSGPAGKDGGNGIDGKDGAPGADGTNGADGKDGAPGPQGEPGPAGEKGIDGVVGINGKDGAPGRDGVDGKDGIDAINGKDGAAGINGEKGIDGRDGKDGRDGREGKDGAPGRDAFELEILPAIDPAKSYARGTFASHKGGLVRALRNSDPLNELDITTLASTAHELHDIVKSGWGVIVEGVASIGAIEAGDLRSFTLQLVMTSGKAVALPFSVPAMIYRGIYQQETLYTRGDTITWGGQVYYCEAPTMAIPMSPGCTDWKLCVKRGQPGAKGADGAAGKNAVPALQR